MLFDRVPSKEKSPETPTRSSDYSMNHQLGEWLSKKLPHCVAAYSNRIDIFWKDEKNRNWAEPIPYNAFTQTFKAECNYHLHKLNLVPHEK